MFSRLLFYELHCQVYEIWIRCSLRFHAIACKSHAIFLLKKLATFVKQKAQALFIAINDFRQKCVACCNEWELWFVPFCLEQDSLSQSTSFCATSNWLNVITLSVITHPTNITSISGLLTSPKTGIDIWNMELQKILNSPKKWQKTHTNLFTTKMANSFSGDS